MSKLTYQGKIIDAHTHLFNPAQGDSLVQMEKAHGYDDFCVLSLEALFPGQNELCFNLREQTGCKVFAGLNRTQGGFAEQARDLIKCGACGFKMIEGKPDMYKQFNEPLNSARNMEFYAELERSGVPLLMHAGDPASFWSKETAPDFALENGWLYEGADYPPLSEIRRQVEDILRQYPNLKLVLAHFFFLGDDMSEAMRLMETYKHLYFDICPGTEMYEQFSKKPDEWRQFFIRYTDKLLFGTDNCDVESHKDLLDKNEINHMAHRFLQTTQHFHLWQLPIQGIGLPTDVLEKIYYKNFEKLTETI